ncbi:MAG: hypothetical protein JSR46_09205, partial [Verrucomicrobia bacterium]|nr:hypothetical protein [Verrucomicrobiota bacterium]
DILKIVISEEEFEQILPKFVREAGLYESAAEVFIPQLQAIYSMRKEAKERPQVEMPNEFREIIMQGVEAIKKLAKTKKSNGSVEEELAHAFLQTKTASRFIDTILPSLLEKIATYHVGPKEGKTFEDRTAELILQFITISQGGFDTIDSYNSREDKKLTGAAWLLAHNYTQERIEAYRKANDVSLEAPIDVEDFLLYETTEHLVATLFPKELLDRIVPEEWKSLNLDQLIVTMTRGYLKQVYDCSQVAKRFGVPQVDPGMLKDMSSYIQKQLPQLLAPKKGEAQEQPWMNRVVEKVFLTGTEEQQKLLARFASNAIYAGVTALFASAEVPKEGDQKANLIDQFGAPARLTQEHFLALNEYEKDKDREKLFEELSADPVQRENRIQAYLKAINKPMSARVEIDMAHFVYWLSARESLEKFFTDANWEKLVPS